MTASYLAILALSLLGFSALALATERHAKHLLRQVPALHWRQLSRALGWLLLALALALSIRQLGSGMGITFWLGWLCMASLVLVFSFPKWPWQPPAPAAVPARKPELPPIPAWPRKGIRQVAATTLLAATVIVFVAGLILQGPDPLKRDDALHGTVGPWTFVLAEADLDEPELVDMDVPLKAFRLRFCETCDLEIRHAYLKVNKPRALRVAGMAFEGARRERRVEIQLPSTVRADSELWLTVVGKDGAVHQTAWPMEQVAPATVRWFEQQRKAQDGR